MDSAQETAQLVQSLTARVSQLESLLQSGVQGSSSQELQKYKERCAELEALLNQSGQVEKSSGHAGRVGEEKQRMTTGQEHTMVSKRLGGDFKIQKNPPFLEQRAGVFDRIMKAQEARHAAKPHKPIKVTLPDGKVVEGTSWETTPMDIAKGISNSLAKKVIVASVIYDGERIAPDNSAVDSSGFDDDAERMVLDDGVGQKPELWDLIRPLEGDCRMRLHTFDDDEGKMVFWHSSAHMMGEALECEFGCHLTIGPPVQPGFYYDSYMGSRNISEKDYPTIEKNTMDVAKQKQQFQRIVLTKQEALELFSENPFKLEIIKTKIPDGGFTTAYRCGPLIDLCMGPHVPDTSAIKAFKVTKHSAVYWLGDEKNDSLQRVYGVSFPDKKLLKKFETNQEEAKKRDHRILGPKYDLYFWHRLSPGCAFFQPHGARLYNTLTNFIRDIYSVQGYSEVVTPNMFNFDLWKVSGHADHYRDDMFLFESDNQEFGLKPMNCPGHCLMFRHRIISYRELPLRMADFGVLHRNEASGALSGLTRVRRFQQDDAHIFCRPDQIKQEVVGALNFMKHVYGIFGMTYKLERSTRPAKAVGADTPEGRAIWDAAEDALGQALDEFIGKGNWRDNPGDGAFYGPKVDIKVYDAMDRKHQCATVQLDFQLPVRFDLRYRTQESDTGDAGDSADAADGEAGKDDGKKGKKGKKDKKEKGDAAADDEKSSDRAKKAGPDMGIANHIREVPVGYARPVMVHRAILGSLERMIAILTEHYAGKWPLWLSPRQVFVVPVSPASNDYAYEVQAKFAALGLYVDVFGDGRNTNMKLGVKTGQLAQYNYIMVVGEEDKANNTVAVRVRDAKYEKRDIPLAEVLEKLAAEVKSKTLEPSEFVSPTAAARLADKAESKE